MLVTESALRVRSQLGHGRRPTRRLHGAHVTSACAIDMSPDASRSWRRTRS